MSRGEGVHSTKMFLGLCCGLQIYPKIAGLTIEHEHGHYMGLHFAT